MTSKDLIPRIVTVVVDDSGSMQGSKASQATAGMRELVRKLQADCRTAHGIRYLINLAKFGTLPVPLAQVSVPDDIPLTRLHFDGTSGGTEIANALIWAEQTLRACLQSVRHMAGYREEHAPTPLVVFVSDGANSGPDISEAAQNLKSIQFADRTIDVVAAGIGVEDKDFNVIRSIASRPALAAQLESHKLSAFLAAVGAVVVAGQSPEQLTSNALLTGA